MGILDRLRGTPDGSSVPRFAPSKDAAPSLAETWLKRGERAIFGPLSSRGKVRDSDELRRVCMLFRRPPVELDGSTQGEALAELMTSRLARPPRECACAAMGRPCITRLNAMQGWALYEAPLAGGLVGNIGVGHGKTLLDILMIMVIPGAKLALLLIPPGQRDQLLRDFKAVAEHFHVPSLIMGNDGTIIPGRPVLHVVPYSQFSRPESTSLMESLKPDLIISDEGQNLRHRATARTGRVLRYFVAHPNTRLCVWSGTLTAKSIKDFAHLSALALGEGSPLPLDPSVVEEWAGAVDPSEWPAPAGALWKLSVDASERMRTEGGDIRQVMHRRLIETRGVISTKGGAVDATINIFDRVPPKMPKKLETMLYDLRQGWLRPDGEELVDILAVAKSARELACGFYYRWRFPKMEPVALIEEWFEKRKAWHRELRDQLKQRSEHLDSPLLLAKAAIRAWHDPPYVGDLPVWYSETWRDWRDIRDKVYHESEAVWVDDYLARDAAKWCEEHRGIVWYEHDAFGRKVAELSGLEMHGGGPGAEAKILGIDGKASIIASIKSHGTGRDGLQRIYREQLVANPPSGGDAWEQLLGRLHRLGQDADEVDTYVYRHTPEMREAIDKAVRYAKYIEGITGNHQKLLASTCNFPLGEDEE